MNLTNTNLSPELHNCHFFIDNGNRSPITNISAAFDDGNKNMLDECLKQYLAPENWVKSSSAIDIKSEKEEKIEYLNKFLELKEGWDGYDAQVISETVISNAIRLLGKLERLPDIFPTPRGSVQFEYETLEKYYEIEIFEDRFSTLYKTKLDQNCLQIPNDNEPHILNIVKEFYA